MKGEIYMLILQAIINKQEYNGVGFPSIIEEVCRYNHLQFDLDFDYNGWEVDWWANILTEDDKLYCKVSGSMYYGTVKINRYNYGENN